MALFAVFSAVFAIGACGGKLAPGELDGFGSIERDASTPPSASSSPAPSATPSAPPSSAPSSSSSSSSNGAYAPAGLTESPDGNDDGSYFPAVPNGPTDTNCSARSVSNDGCTEGAEAQFQKITAACAAESFFCGDAYVDVDVLGCAADLRLGETPAKFVSCMTTALNGTRWTCVDKARLHAHEVTDCLSRDE